MMVTTVRTRRLISLALGAALVLGACSSSGDDEADDTTTTEAEAEAATTSEADEPTDGDADPWTIDAREHRGDIGATVDLDCPAGGEADTIWGVETYTDDSSICTAAVHVGLITFDEGGEVTIEIAPGQERYEGGAANDVISRPYAAWEGSFTFPDAPPGSGTFELAGDPWELSVDDLALVEGQTYDLACGPGGTLARVWGSDPYTSDSGICSAAVHAGLIDLAEGGEVTVEAVAGADEYEGSEANGVTTDDYGSYSLSFTFPDDQP